jgi:hypothetical protein
VKLRVVRHKLPPPERQLGADLGRLTGDEDFSPGDAGVVGRALVMGETRCCLVEAVEIITGVTAGVRVPVLWICGPAGVGKSTTARAVDHEIATADAVDPDARALGGGSAPAYHGDG